MQRHKAAKSTLPFQPPFFYGWLMVAVGALGVFFSGPGQTYSVSVFINSYIEEFGWSRSFVSSLYSMGTLFAGLILPIIGRNVDKLGHRRMSSLITLLFGTACFFMSFVGSPVMLFMGFFLIRLLGQGSMSLSSVTLVPQWFVSKRGRALSLMALGGAISSAVLPPLNTWIIQTYGWRIGWQVWGVLLWAVMLPIALLLIRNRPEEVGLLPDGLSQVQVSNHALHDEQDQDSWTAKEAIRTRAFWLLLLCTAIPSAVGTGMIFHQVSILGEAGISAQTTAFVMSLMALVQLPVSLIAGYIADKVKIRYVIACNFAVQIIILLVLLNTRSVHMAIFYGVLRGITGAFEAIQSGVLWPSYFGRKHLGSIRGVAMTASVLGSAFGPLPFGFAFDFFGGYKEVLLLAMIFPAIGAVAALLSPPPVKKQTEAPEVVPAN